MLNEYSERVNQRLRSIFMKTFSEHLVAIMSGVGIKRIWKSEGSPWYNFFDEIELTAFTPRGGGGADPPARGGRLPLRAGGGGGDPRRTAG